MELLVALGIVSLLSLIAYPNLSAMNRQLDVSGDTRILMQKIASWRSDAILMRAPLSVSFSAQSGSTPAQYEVDYFADGSVDEVVQLERDNVWTTTGGNIGVPGSLRFSGLGLVTNIAGSSIDIGVKNASTKLGVKLHRSGIAEFTS